MTGRYRISIRSVQGKGRIQRPATPRVPSGTGKTGRPESPCAILPSCHRRVASFPQARTGRTTVNLFDGVAVQYSAGPPILHDVTFTLAPGSFHFLVGRSGAGKSSMLKVMYLGLRPTRGTVSLFGRDVASLNRAEMPALRRRIVVVFQDFRLIEHLSTFDN